MGKREDNKIEKSQASVRDMVDAVTAGDLSAASDAFDTLVAAKREHEWVNAKHDLARTAFEYETIIAPEVDPTPIDTGISGDPAEVGEALSAVDQATMAHAKGDTAKSKAILKNRAKAKAADKLGKEIDAKTMAHARNQ